MSLSGIHLLPWEKEWMGMPEFIQEDATPEAMAEAVGALLDDPKRREEIGKRFATLRAELALAADDRAAEAVISLANH